MVKRMIWALVIALFCSYLQAVVAAPAFPESDGIYLATTTGWVKLHEYVGHPSGKQEIVSVSEKNLKIMLCRIGRFSVSLWKVESVSTAFSSDFRNRGRIPIENRSIKQNTLEIKSEEPLSPGVYVFSAGPIGGTIKDFRSTVIVVKSNNLGANPNKQSQRFETYRNCLHDSDQQKWRVVNAFTYSGKIIVDSTDKSFIEHLKGGEAAILDKRTLAILYLLSLEHQSLKVRLISGHETQEKACYNDESKSGEYLSSHYFGQAIDIFVADGVDLSWRGGRDPIKNKKAKDKIKELAGDILYIGSLDRNFCPTQLIVQEGEDILPHNKMRDLLYGWGEPGSADQNIARGSRRGFGWRSENQGRIHIGY